MSRLLVRFRWLVAIAALLLVVAVGRWAYLRFFTNPMLRTAEDGINAIERGDGQALWAYVGATERANVCPNAGVLTNLLRQYVLPVYVGLKPTGRVDLAPMEDLQALSAERHFWKKPGKQVAYALIVRVTDEGVQIPMLVSQLVMSAGMTKYYAQQPGESSSSAKVRAYYQAVLRDKEQLKAIGMQGIYRNDREGPLTWDQYEEICKKRWERQQEALRRARQLPSPGVQIQ
jgi:hypothetical protein